MTPQSDAQTQDSRIVDDKDNVIVVAAKALEHHRAVDVSVTRPTGSRHIVAVSHLVAARTEAEASNAGLCMGRNAIDGI